MILRLVKVSLVLVVGVSCSVFDTQLYQDVLDPEECQRQLMFLANDTLGLQFIDASGKIPPGMMKGNLIEMGDYHQCLDINRIIDDFDIRGKYCTVSVPFAQNPIQLPGVPALAGDLTRFFKPSYETLEVLKKYELTQNHLLKVFAGFDINDVLHPNDDESNDRIAAVNVPLPELTVAVCVPRVCTATEALDFFLDRLVILNLTYTENFCRLPQDKPYVAADYIAITLFCVIGIITIFSTGYDLMHKFVWKKHPSEGSALLRSFSVYTNTRRLVTVRPTPGALECLDGIRVISMLWVIVGHTFYVSFSFPLHNLSYSLQWAQMRSSVWLLSAPISVDTFFLLSGVLCVYSTVGKVNQRSFIRSIPLFYMNRILRMFPLLGTMVLLQASLLNHMADGPNWYAVSSTTMACRDNWWITLLYIQSFFNGTKSTCLGQSWYLSVDMQLYIVCPVVLMWLFRRQRVAWLALTTAIVASLVTTTVFCFMNDYPSSFFNFNATNQASYIKYYYVNSLTRAPPFIIGMMYGYILHVWRDKKIRIERLYNCVLWILSLLMMALIIYSHTATLQPDYDNQTLDNLLNSYMRAVWAIVVGWVILACVHGYGGPVNWFLSLQLWKVPARISYAMFLVHYPLMFLVNGTNVKSHYFGAGESLYRFTADLSITMVFSFILCITIDAPASTLQKILFQGGRNKKTESVETVVAEKSEL